ncbi:LacI family transcriptional regulator [Serratia nevei]|uniref:LacI family DNA-binding transcriptional regulator n=1 Tax=Serratia marcescens TaxID=615 RepID=UPI000E1D7F43|nr:LacI family DNA-binding transcriptional regulator [Serratia marcescens]AXK22916.1 Transcriptional regulator, LacI family [Serratia marcescens]MBL0872397.1 LacI family transcriptional regulator [Serratia nevei]
MSNLKDVAKKAGVSVTTVSNFINDKKAVKEETRIKILEAIKDTGYRYNTAAALLKRNSTEPSTIAIISVVDQNNFFSELFFRLESECFNKGYAVVSCFRQEDSNNLKKYISLISGKVDGIILISICKDKIDSIIKNVHAIPVVAIAFDIGSVASLCGGTQFDLHNQMGGYIAGRYLVAKGHRSLACVTGPADLKTTKDRINGLESALAETGLPVGHIKYIEGDYSYDSGIAAMYALYSSGKLPTAVMCHNDLMAVGVQNAASELGIKIPKDMSVMGYDDIETARMANPPLTTVRIPLENLATQAIDELIKKINEPGIPALISVNPVLVVRGSVDEPPMDKARKPE